MPESRQKKHKTKKPASPSRRNQALQQMRARYPHYDLISNFFGVCFLVGIGLTVWEIGIYRRTIVPAAIPVCIWLFGGVALLPLFRRLLNIYIFNPYNPGHLPLFFQLVFNVVACGGMIVFGFMQLNTAFASTDTTDVTVQIEATGHFAKTRHGCGEPYAEVRYKSELKQLVFGCGTPVEKYKLVHLQIAKGLFGFEVIKGQELRYGDW